MEHVKLESITDSPAFWNDPFSISSYCNSILQSTKKENEEVSIMVSDYNTIPRVSYEKRNGSNKYCIYLPKLKDFYIDENIQVEDIKLRKAFLKHELAHIIFSEMENYSEHHSESVFDMKMLANSLEDVRIENFFGKRFPGSNDTFFEVQKKFYLKGKKTIETEKPSIRNLALYFLYRSKRFEFENTFPIQIYDSVFQKNSDFLSISNEEVVKLLSKIKFDFDSELKTLEDEVQQYNNEIPEKEKITIDRKDFEENFSESELEEDPNGQYELEIENDFPQSKSPNIGSPEEFNSDQKESESDSESEEESESDFEEDSENNDKSEFEDDSNFDSENESENDFEDNSEDDFEDNSKEVDDYDNKESSIDSSNKEKKDSSEEDSNFESSDFSNMIKEQMSSNLKKEEENLNNFNSENKIDDFDLDSLKEDIGEDKKAINILKIIQPVSDYFINEVDVNSNSTSEFLKYNNSKMKNQGAKIIDISGYINLISSRNKKNNRGKKKLNSNNRSLYSTIASKNNKNIISLTNFFKLKFQGKEKSKRFYNKEAGDLNNESLYKLFSKENDNRIFSSIEKSLVTKEDVTFLLDFSGSMSGSKIKYLFESLVILNEVFTKIEIPYNVFSFTGKTPRFNIKYGSLSEKTMLTRAFNSKYFNVSIDKYDKDFLYFSALDNIYNLCFCIINRNCKSEERKKIIDYLLRNVFERNVNHFWSEVLFGGGTPEIQSMISLYNNLPKQKLFLINDGEYDRVNFFDKGIEKIAGFDSFNIRKIDFYKFGLNMLLGKEVFIKNAGERTLFLSAIRVISNNLSNGSRFLYNSNPYNFFTDDVNFQSSEINTASSIIDSYRSLLYDILYDRDLFENKDHKIENKYFILEKKYNSRTDVSTFKIIIKDYLPSFKLKVYNKIISFSKKNYYTNEDVMSDLFLDKDEITEISDIYKIICFNDISNLSDIIKRNDITQYTYLDLVNKMRNSGWSIFGIGIDSDYGKNYIGDSNFTYVKNYVDIRENLEKKIKKIVN